MPVMRLKLGPEPIWPDLEEKIRQGLVYHLSNESVIEVGALDGGMVSGRPSIAFRIDLPDGKVVVAETSLGLFQTVNAGLRGRFGDVA